MRWTLGAAVGIACLVAGYLATTDYGLITVAALLVGVFAFTHPRQMVLVAIAVAIWPAAFGSLLGYGLMTAAIAGASLRHGKRVRALGKTGIALAALAAIITASHFFHDPPIVVDISEARNHLYATLLGLGFIVAVVLVRLDQIVALRTLAVSGAASAGYLLIVGQATTSGRIEAETLNENSVGYVGALAAVAAFGLFARTRRFRWLLVAVAPVILAVLSQSRGAALALVVGVGLVWGLRRTGAARVLVIVLAPVVAFLALPVVQSLVATYFSRRDLATAESTARLRLLQLAGDLTLEHPFIGVGWRAFPDHSLARMGRAMNTHDEYARLAAESGVLALVLFVAVAAVALRSNAVPAVKATLVAGLVAFGFANAMSNPAVSMPVWVLLGVALAVRSRGRAVGDQPIRGQRGKQGSERSPVSPRSGHGGLG